MAEMRNRRIKILAIILAISIFGCSQNKVAGGNSAETGNPELSGTIYLSNGTVAANAMVRCIPANFSPANDTLDSLYLVHTDSAGSFAFDSLPNGSYSLEVYHPISGERLYTAGLAIQNKRQVILEKNLSPTGRMRVAVNGAAEGSQLIAFIPGSTIFQHKIVKYQSVFMDSLPAAQFDSLVLLYPNGDIATMGTTIQVQAGITTTLLSPSPITHQVQVTLNTSATGVNLLDTLRGFPLALRLDSSDLDFDAITATTPLHIHWKDDSTTEVPYRISRWDMATQSAVLWVRLDTLLPQNIQQALTLTWDESTAPSFLSQQPFGLEDGYYAAWHFDEGATKFLDASQSAYDGEPIAITEDSGVVGKGYRFDYNTSHVHIPGSAAGLLNFGFNDTMSISVWVNLQAANTSRFVFGKGTYQYYLKYQSPSGWLFESDDESATTYRYIVESTFDTLALVNRWMLLTVVQRGAHVELWSNDSLLDSVASVGLAAAQRYTASTLEIGQRLAPSGSLDQPFVGLMDEMSISNKARSPEWIRLLYRNQQPLNYWP